MVSAADKPTALDHKDIEKVQQSLSDKGFYHGSVDGIIGPIHGRAFASIRHGEFAGHRTPRRGDGRQTGSGPESVGGSFKEAGQDVGKGGQEVGHEMKNGKPVAAGKEFGKDMGRAGREIRKGSEEGCHS